MVANILHEVEHNLMNTAMSVMEPKIAGSDGPLLVTKQ